MACAGDEIERLRERLDEADFSGLLIGELGWDNPVAGQEVRHDEDGTVARLVADKRGVGIWVVDGLPGPGPRRRIDVLIARRTRERLVIFDDGVTQLWMWPEQRASGAGFRLVSHEYHVGSRNEALLQRLATARFRLEEEDDLTVVDVLARVRRSFNAERVTKKFYGEFKDHRDSLVDQIDGLEFKEEVAWYASVLLNRLMLLYFLQKKGFLDGDRDYLRNRLGMVRGHLGDDAFYGFFRRFLLPLFHDGLGSHRQEYEDADIKRIVGDVPYVNGGIFQKHVLEEENEIDVPDEVFESIFGFFDRYRWHLDDRPSDDVDEINPDVLGYVFEQLVNSKEKGAYYTKEDVTGYMTTATIASELLCRLDPGGDYLTDAFGRDPDRYIPDSIRYGVEEPLPESVLVGLEDSSERSGWARRAGPAVALPTENWWEVIDRRRRYERVRQRMAAGEVCTVAEAVTENLDLRLLLEDQIASLVDIDGVEAALDVARGLTVLDPTCGSGAFLFAALDLLADLYESLLERASELMATGERKTPLLGEAEKHPNRRYFVLRFALLNNIYGVDLMEEAVEIARLRLFLRLAAQVDDRSDLEPFPDLDMNVKPGNLLVGVASAADAGERICPDIFRVAEVEKLSDEAREVAELFSEFRSLSVANSEPEKIARLKNELRETLNEMRPRVDAFLHQVREEREDLKSWVGTHQPFHWFLEFPGVFADGGFRVVVGNPPYIKSADVKEYRWRGYQTDGSPDIYGICLERSLGLLGAGGRFGMIVPHSVSFSRDLATTRKVLERRLSEIWVSSYSRIPSGLFPPEIRVRNSIVLGVRDEAGGRPLVHTTRCRRWNAEYRPHLLETTAYATPSPSLCESQWPFLGSDRLGEYLDRRVCRGRTIGEMTVSGRGRLVPQASVSPDESDGAVPLLFRTNGYNWLPVFPSPPPAFGEDGNRVPQSKLKAMWFRGVGDRDAALGVLAGKWGFAWWATYGDDFHVTVGVLESLPFSREAVTRALEDDPEMVSRLEAELLSNVVYKLNAGKKIGNFDLSVCRHITDQFDRRLCAEFEEPDLVMEELELLYHQTIRTTG